MNCSRSSRCIRGVSLIVCLSSLVIASAAYADNPAIKVQVAIEQLYRPVHDRFATRTAALVAATRQLCERVSAGEAEASTSLALQQVRERYVDTVDAFSHLELLQVGPIMQEHRLFRLFFWPDERRVARRQIRALLQTMARQPLVATNTRSLQGKSVAVQGLAALEWLLFSHELVDISTQAVGCALSLDIASNIDALASELARAWAAPNGIAERLMHPASDAQRFRSHAEVTARMLSQVSAGLELIAWKKALPMSKPGARWHDAPFARSGATLLNLQGNLESLQSLLEVTDMLRRAGLQREVGFEFRIARAHLDRLAQQQAFANPGGFVTPRTRENLRALQKTVAGLASTTADRVAPALQVRPGFNASDGD